MNFLKGINHVEGEAKLTSIRGRKGKGGFGSAKLTAGNARRRIQLKVCSDLRLPRMESGMLQESLEGSLRPMVERVGGSFLCMTIRVIF